MPATDTNTSSDNSEPVAWRIKAWRRLVGDMGNTKFYQERNSGRIKTVKCGSNTLVVTPPKQYVAMLRDQAA